MKWRNSCTRTVVFDVVVIIAMLVAQGLVVRIPPFLRGFYCDDTTIAYPYKKDTVTTGVLMVISLVMPIVVFVTVELSLRKWLSQDKLDSRGWPKKAVAYGGNTMYHVIITFLFGACATSLLTLLGKVTVGRLRPNFLSICQPIGDAFLQCATQSSKFVEATAYVCNGSAAGYTQNQLIDSRLSFPSGHASTSVYAMTFLILYFQARLTWNETRLLRGALQTGAAALACLCSWSRVTDNKHHATDVLAGVILGFSAAVFVIFGTLRLMPVVSLRDLKRLRQSESRNAGSEVTPINSEPPDAAIAVGVSVGETNEDAEASKFLILFNSTASETATLINRCLSHHSDGTLDVLPATAGLSQ